MRDSIENIRMHSIINKIGLIIIILMSCTLMANSQDSVGPQKSIRNRMSLNCIQKTGEGLALAVKLRYKKGKTWTPIQDELILFYLQTDTLDIPLGEIKTNKDGMAILSIPNDKMIQSDTAGMMNFKTLFGGSDGFKSSQRTTAVKKAILELEAVEIDSVRSIQVTFYEINKDGTKISVPEKDVNVYAKRLYSNLKILELYTDDEGVGVDAFPDDLPGNDIGLISLIARIDDTDDYGTIENSMDVTWGVPVSNELSHAERSLWTVEAPLWMVITFWILMCGVWFHYFWIIYLMFKKSDDYVEFET